MHLEEVLDETAAKHFLLLPLDIYKGNPTWVRPLDKDIQKVFDPKQNRFFSHGQCTRWILWNEEKTKVIGRVAAFINERTAKSDKVGGLGFFECIEDKNAAFILFDTCKAWLLEKGMEAMDGPINFGEKSEWWGLLVEGFDRSPLYQMNYNPPYYRAFFEEYGFQLYFNQYNYGLVVRQPRPEKYVKLWPSYKNNPDYLFTNAKKRNMEKYAEDFRTVYNKSWGKHAGFKQMSEAQSLKVMKSIKPIMVEELLQFAYHKGEPIGFYLSIPELNQYFKYVNGNLNWWGMLVTWVLKTFKRNQKFMSIVYGVVPEFQGKGIEGMMVMNLNDWIIKRNKWKDIELTWIGDFNPKMIRVAENLGADIVKKFITYRFNFDRNKPFERHPMIL
jgi:hypothetical protein